ncbi:DUF3237 domain-containing protein [Streptomyces sp. NBC_00988]|uniref:DUF3237 domain-containing protein n=1 Tax=Streptomyces sp. NBC_00988 TaxID=2903704 RepID=UPI00386C0918|nr:DUF3237 domain-containing protein [Streptomyces sp. NBC_00988]
MPREEFELDDSVRPTHLDKVPELEHVLTSRVVVEPAPLRLGNVGEMGQRLMLNIKGGDFEGPKLRGTILPGGGDWPLIRPDGVGLTDARYTYLTDDGVLINIYNTGYRHGSEEAIRGLDAKEGVVDPSSYYLRQWSRFEAPQGRYEWMSRHVFIGIAERHPKVLFIKYFMVH